MSENETVDNENWLSKKFSERMKARCPDLDRTKTKVGNRVHYNDPVVHGMFVMFLEGYSALTRVNLTKGSYIVVKSTSEGYVSSEKPQSHKTFHAAQSEAVRLAKKHVSDFAIMKTVTVVDNTVEPIHEYKKKSKTDQAKV